MNCRHQMPFGAECRGDGTVRFRLWAPQASAVSLDISSQHFPMLGNEDGWFEIVVPAGAGAHYQFTIDGRDTVPDPASRFQPLGVHGPSEIIDPNSFRWRDESWHGRDWDGTVAYEMHVGTFSAEGTFAGAIEKLDYLAEVGFTAIEMMPLSSFPGERNWGYDGVLPYAPAHSYGRPEDLKNFIDAAHAKNMMVFLDVVYNHFGPEGNYLAIYAPQFFTHRYQTPWGQAINFDGPHSRTVRDFFIHNALYWLQEYRFDGLRFDAVHAIHDDSMPDVLTELAETVRSTFGDNRLIHLVLENDDNAAHYLRRDARDNPSWYTAQWNDDVHHALHVLVTRESDGYYSGYCASPAWHLGRCLAEGYSYQGEPSPYRGGNTRGEPSSDLPPDAFVSFLQNHDQIGNRALGERIIEIAGPRAVKAAVAVLLLAPSPPLVFMGEEFGAASPFLFFCDFGTGLAAKVTAGRRSEFARFVRFSSPEAQARIPDPNSEQTFLRSKLDWTCLDQPANIEWLRFYRELLACRRDHIVPRLKDIVPEESGFVVLGDQAVSVRWPFATGGELSLFANLGNETLLLNERPAGRLLYTTGNRVTVLEKDELPQFSVAWFLKP